MVRLWSVVVPVKNETDKLYHNLISLCKLNPSEIIICTDEPAPRSIVKLVDIISHRFELGEKIHVLPVARNDDYLYHQARVRRCGFLKAKNDIILTADVDLIVNKNVLKGLELIGKNKVGIATFAKLRLSDKSLTSYGRLFTTTLMRWLHYLLFRHIREGKLLSGFTGLYWLYRPYWKDTEGNSIKSLPVPLGKEKKTSKNIVHNTGEDVHLRNQMIKKFKSVFIARIGAKVISDERPHEEVRQIIHGKSSAQLEKSIFGVLVHSLFYIEPLYFKTYLAERKRIQAERTNNPNP